MFYNFRCILSGRNAPANEPWPDVLGVAVVFLVTGMFMLGLEVSRLVLYIYIYLRKIYPNFLSAPLQHSKAFSLLMTLGMFGLNAILSAVGWWRGNFQAWSENYFQPNGISSVSGSVATLIYSPFPIPLLMFALLGQCTVRFSSLSSLFFFFFLTIDFYLVLLRDLRQLKPPQDMSF